MKLAYLLAVAAAAAAAGAAEFIVGVDSGDFAHPFSGC